MEYAIIGIGFQDSAEKTSDKSTLFLPFTNRERDE
jgi:hypothetical protein